VGLLGGIPFVPRDRWPAEDCPTLFLERSVLGHQVILLANQDLNRYSLLLEVDHNALQWSPEEIGQIGSISIHSLLCVLLNRMRGVVVEEWHSRARPKRPRKIPASGIPFFQAHIAIQTESLLKEIARELSSVLLGDVPFIATSMGTLGPPESIVWRAELLCHTVSLAAVGEKSYGLSIDLSDSFRSLCRSDQIERLCPVNIGDFLKIVLRNTPLFHVTT
jgi:hypothetical protein